MLHPAVDALLSPTLKHLRERWWNDEFTGFLVETLRPRAGNRILDVGCGAGAAEVSLGRLHVSQIELYGVDLKVDEVIAAARETASHNHRARFAAGDACRLPFRDGAFDSTYCVAVLQHIADVDTAVAELARVTRPGGRIVAVEPDNSARYAYSSSRSGSEAFRMAAEFFAEVAAARGDTTNPAIGAQVPELFARHAIDPILVRLFPVSYPRLGAPSAEIWAARRAAVERALVDAGDRLRALGQQYLAALDAYERESREAGPIFVEMQNTMLFATVGQKAS
jgi:ubiquinone/menaquinone biosynthesis C-methylase UbiE